MEAVIFIGIQASGKSSFFKQRFFDTHVRINLDMLRTRHRESLLVQACLDAKQPFVVDNTNPSPEDRARYVTPARAAGFGVIAYYFQSSIAVCKQRNAGRAPDKVVPDRGLLGTYSRLVLPSLDEGFDQLFYVKAEPGGGFAVEEWSDEV